MPPHHSEGRSREYPLSTSAARRADDQRLFERYRRDGDRDARDALVERFLPLAQHFARRYHGTGSHAEDVQQIAAIGLINAIDRFDPDRGIAFSSFAVPTIVGEIKRYFRDRGWTVRVPRELQERALAVERLSEELERRSGRAPTAEQVAEHMDASVEHVVEARLAAYAHHGVSLDRPSGLDEDQPQTLADTLGVADDGFRRAESAAMFDRMLEDLTGRERTILRLRFEKDLSQAEIGERVGLSQMHVSRIIRGAIDQLRESSVAARGTLAATG
jgi:RNA polymerase sigma-B factor